MLTNSWFIAPSPCEKVPPLFIAPDTTPGYVSNIYFGSVLLGVITRQFPFTSTFVIAFSFQFGPPFSIGLGVPPKICLSGLFSWNGFDIVQNLQLADRFLKVASEIAFVAHTWNAAVRTYLLRKLVKIDYVFK